MVEEGIYLVTNPLTPSIAEEGLMNSYTCYRCPTMLGILDRHFNSSCRVLCQSSWFWTSITPLTL